MSPWVTGQIRIGDAAVVPVLRGQNGVGEGWISTTRSGSLGLPVGTQIGDPLLLIAVVNNGRTHSLNGDSRFTVLRHISPAGSTIYYGTATNLNPVSYTGTGPNNTNNWMVYALTAFAPGTLNLDLNNVNSVNNTSRPAQIPSMGGVKSGAVAFISSEHGLGGSQLSPQVAAPYVTVSKHGATYVTSSILTVAGNPAPSAAINWDDHNYFGGNITVVGLR